MTQARVLNRDRLAEVLSYCPDSGVLRWKHRQESQFSSLRSARSWNGKHAGRPAGTLGVIKTGQKYLLVRLDGECHQASRMAWTIHHGDIPAGMVIDHINGSTEDNRICNLRCVLPADNSKNQALRRSSKSGVTGVYWSSKVGRWHANVWADGRRHSLGYHDDLDSAKRARAEADRKYGFHPLHGCTEAQRAQHNSSQGQ